MRALVLGLVIGLIVGGTVTLVLLGDSMSATGSAISTAGNTITLPANTAFGAVDADFVIVNGRIEPRTLRIEARRLTELSVLVISGPGRITIPHTGDSTPLLSDRQVHTFPLRIDEQGSYEIICRPCGTQQSLDSAYLVVI